MAAMQDIVLSRGWRDQLDDLVPRRQQVVVIALIAAVAVGGSLFWSMRSAPPKIAPPAQSSSVATSGPSASAASAEPSEGILVHVAGAVRKPGLYEFPTGARVADAIASAGGPKPGADLDALNLAELLTDGSKLLIARRGAEAAPITTVSGSPSPGLVNINTADQVALETIPGIGPVTAAAILDQRARLGSFESFEQLLEVDGIGPATLESIRSYITF
jgi:competence protein ComEA